MFLRTVELSDLTESDRNLLFQRGSSLESVFSPVRQVIDEVKSRGDEALLELTERFDGAQLEDIAVGAEEVENATRQVPEDVRTALLAEQQAVERFHQDQLPQEQHVETSPGVVAWREWRAIESVGLYVPGGRASYPSSVIMLGVPARLAGCDQIVLCTPPDAHGKVPAATLLAAQLCGIDRIFKIGGAQAIAAMAYGTQTVPKVVKIFGAGNAYVTAAKLLVFPDVALDVPAGPSELLILADETADPAWIAADLLSDAEHGPDSPAVLFTTSLAVAQHVSAELQRQIETLPRREIAARALHRHGLAVVCADLDSMTCLANDYAAEHLEIVTRAPAEVLTKISNAGSVFLGPYSPNAAGDYATGTNHVLPTARYARMFSPVSVESFGRLIQCQELTPGGLAGIAGTITQMARAERLEGHARAVEVRQAGDDGHGR